MQKKLIVLVIILIITLSVIGYKSYNLHNYDIKSTNISLGNELKITNDKKVTKEVQGNLKFSLDEEYKIDSTTTKYILEEDKYITFSEVTNIKRTVCNYDNKLIPIEYEKIMSKNKMKNEVDIIKYNADHKNEKINILSSINKIKANYFATIFINSLKIEGEVNILNGLDGIKNNNTIYLFNKGNMYKVEFTSNYTEEEIVNLLNTFKFD